MMRIGRGNPETWTDERLLKAVAERDGSAYSAFYRRHLPATLAYLVRETHDHEQAADLAAEVFSAVLLAADRYEPRGESALPWVIGIARNKLLMSFRRGRIEARARQKLGMEPVELSDESLERVEVLAGEGAGKLELALEQLPYLEREAVRSHVVHELGYSEIAAELATSEMVVRKRVSRGLKKLREQVVETRTA
jgi:RNA polymerase sigma factor (sigma-70 family)